MRFALLVSGAAVVATVMLSVPASGAAARPTGVAAYQRTAAATLAPEDVVTTVRVHNLSRYTLRFERLQSEAGVEAAPKSGTLLPSGQFQTFRLVVYFFAEPRHYASYELLDHNGVKIGDLTVKIKVAALPSPNGHEVSCLAPIAIIVPGNPTPECRRWHVLFESEDLTVQDPPGLPPVVYTPAQAVAQRDAFRYLCAFGGANCDFTVTSQAHGLGDLARVTEPLANRTDKVVTQRVRLDWRVSLTQILHSTISTDSKVYSRIAAALKQRSGYDWEREHTYMEEMYVPVKPHGCAAVSAAVPVIYYRGDLSISAGNTTWKLTDVLVRSLDFTSTAQTPKLVVDEWPPASDGKCS